MNPLSSSPPDAADRTAVGDGADLVAIGDAARLAAYETLTARERSWIKATLALVESAHGARPAETDSRTLRAEHGLIRLCRTRPASWTLCVPGAGFASAPRFAAAIMCARLAGVENLLAIWPLADSAACPPARLAVLELAGVDQAYTLSASGTDLGAGLGAGPASPSFWRGLADELDQSGDAGGRLLYFGARDGLYAALRELADARGLPMWTDRPPLLKPEIPAPAAMADGLDETAIRWAHPDAGTHSPPGAPRAGLHTARYTARYTAHPEADLLARPEEAALTLGPGLEGCWLHPDLSPDFFLTHKTTIIRTG
jgi:hypothetical protein